MARITITTETPYGPPTIEGWFDPDKSNHYPEERTEDLEGNRTGACSGTRARCAGISPRSSTSTRTTKPRPTPCVG